MTTAARVIRAAGSVSRRRWYSATGARQEEELDTFLPSSTAKLDKLLADAREQVLVPGMLTLQQRRYVSNKENKPVLEMDPLLVSIGTRGETAEVRYRNLIADTPPKRRTGIQIIQHARTDTDWKNVAEYIRLSSLCRTSSQGESSGLGRLSEKTLERFVIQALRSGQVGIVISMVVDAAVSRIVLGRGRMLFIILRGLRQNVADATEGERGSRLVETIRAIELVHSQMNLRIHEISQDKQVSGPDDLRVQAWVLAPLIELQAISLLKAPQLDGSSSISEQTAREDEITRFRRARTRFLSILSAFEPRKLDEFEVDRKSRRRVTDYIGTWEPVWSALVECQKLAGAFTVDLSSVESQQVAQYANLVKQHLDEAAARLANAGYNPTKESVGEWRDRMVWSRR